ncbi:winged helix-turn-helix transcriptional regulator [Breznakiella homolactica]|uniref:Helix-turn-helix transcriptional regulator n=1 Tax=Breznakiella homolactica TaxID=2798577 RepID=A0A7T7XM45_9SPIR|nr:helix-turn-helix domain-containing protein [Breznakiella homolactica]QQO08787.1 helix-turn-helix transcriptional regulator [Breznakiella homolactica]
MGAEYISEANLEESGFSYTLSLISGKYKMAVLYGLSAFGVVRYNEMKRFLKTVSHKTLSLTLKELEADGLVHRKEYPQIPPKVEYSLTSRGKSLIPILDALCDWGEKNRRKRKPGNQRLFAGGSAL